jgi:hypothetical protein
MTFLCTSFFLSFCLLQITKRKILSHASARKKMLAFEMHHHHHQQQQQQQQKPKKNYKKINENV